MFISFISQKGGTGKSTLSIHIAALMARSGCNTLLIDADPQASTMAWLACRARQGYRSIPGLTVMAISNGTITDQLPQLARSYGCIIIDGPPGGDRTTRDVVLASDLVLVPVGLSGFDVWAGDSISHTIEQLRPVQQRASKQPLDWYYIISKKNRTLAGKSILKALEKKGNPLLDSQISQRACFVESTSQGLTIFETEPAASKASREILALGDELQTLIRQRQQRKNAA